jgi:hypothetical protein
MYSHISERADSNTAQSILLYQKLVKLLERLVDGVDIDLDKRLQDVNGKVHNVKQAIRDLKPMANKAKDDLLSLDRMISIQMRQTVEVSVPFPLIDWR